MRRPQAIFASTLLLSSVSFGAEAAEYIVTMLNPNYFDPAFIKIAPGDTVHFVAESGHNAESIAGMIPDGAQPFAGPTGQDLIVRLTVPGVYGYRCEPHSHLGMVGLIVVGTPANEQSAKAAAPTGRAHKTFAKLFQQLDEQVSQR